MTFEEFLTKKKIDLAQFRTAEPGLFSEFQHHYSQMGPKSFDHSKKFLFNKLRRTYHLMEEPKIVPAKEGIQVNEIAAQAEPLLSPTVEATVYTPRFRTGGAAKNEAESDKVKAESSEPFSQTNKPAYTPRFKAQPPQKSESIPNEKPKDTAEPTKPAFRPRFKPGLTGTGEARPPEDTTEEVPVDIPKPVYVPSFKAPLTPKDAEEPAAEPPVEKPKPAYVPRFKAPITTTAADETEFAEKVKLANESTEEIPAEPKPGYVPRFKASARPKPTEDTGNGESKDKS